MDAPHKLKLALDETRMLVLGAQVLLGFQLRSAFQERFEKLSPHAKALDAASLLLMVLVIGLLVTPAIHHRSVENGNATPRIMRTVSLLMALALLPFAVSLGFNVFVAVESFAGTAWATASSLLVTTLALWFWFGLEWIAISQKQKAPMNYPNQEISLPSKIDQMLTEARVILPAAQAVLGFQLAVILTDEFEKLQPVSKVAHTFALIFVALATILLMAPAAYHRIVYGGDPSQTFLDLGGGFVMAATFALALGLATDVYVVIGKIAHSGAIGLAAAMLSLSILSGLWHVSPFLMRQRVKTSAGSVQMKKTMRLAAINAAAAIASQKAMRSACLTTMARARLATNAAGNASPPTTNRDKYPAP